jgi:hypothetical protein
MAGSLVEAIDLEVCGTWLSLEAIQPQAEALEATSLRLTVPRVPSQEYYLFQEEPKGLAHWIGGSPVHVFLSQGTEDEKELYEALGQGDTLVSIEILKLRIYCR